MAVKLSSNLDTLNEAFDSTAFTQALAQKNVRRAWFTRQEVEQLVKSLDDPNLRSSGASPCPYIVVYLVLENDPDPNVNEDRINLAMAGASADFETVIFADLTETGIPNQALLADRPCPPDCPGDQGSGILIKAPKLA